MLIHKLIRCKPEGRADWQGRNEKPAKLAVQDFRPAKQVVADVRAKLQAK